jgi:hypothetical protein
LLNAQNYQAVHGSSYAGSLGAANNPASIVHVPFAWDVTPLAIQLKHSTNIFTINNYSLLSPGKNVEARITTGAQQRFLMANQDIRLLNARIRLNASSAIAFGASIRSYFSVKTSVYNWQDSIGTLRGFMNVNFNNTPLSTEVRANAWAEIFGTYARTIIDNSNARLNGGITIKVNRGLGGAYATASNLDYFPATIHGQSGYLLRSGQLEYGYSSNFDVLDSSGNFASKRKQFFNKTYSTIAASLGVEYIIPSGKEGDEDNEYMYDLKIGVSLLDIGYNNFQYSPNSRRAVLNKNNVSDSLINATFGNINGTDALSDSLQSISGNINNLFGNFKIFQPARLVINADKHLTGNFFINGELTFPLTSLLGKNNLFVQDMNLLAVTPRYETKGLGVYLPVTLNTRKQLWVGGAIKLGPLLLGIHSWANLLSKNKMQNGGAYLALTFRPGKKQRDDDSHSARTKEGRLPRKQGRQLGCPVPK